MYEVPIRAKPGLANGDLLNYLKDATIEPAAIPESVQMPRPGVTITRDAFVPIPSSWGYWIAEIT